MRFLGVFTVCLLSVAAFSQSVPAADRKDSTAGIRFRCMATITSSTPLFVIDGVAVEEKEISDIDANTVEKIEILKRAEGTALFGARGEAGVIWITTKKINSCKLVIRDLLTGENLTGATVRLSSNDHTVMAIAGKDGIAVPEEIKKGTSYNVTVTMAGYVPFDSVFDHLPAGYVIGLKKDVKSCPEVVVIAHARTITCSHIECISQVFTLCSLITTDSTGKYFTEQTAVLYPNPVPKGQAVTVRLKSKQEGAVQVKIFSLDGRLLRAEPQKTVNEQGNIVVLTDSRWSAGAYIVQLADAAGKGLYSGKLIIQ